MRDILEDVLLLLLFFCSAGWLSLLLMAVYDGLLRLSSLLILALPLIAVKLWWLYLLRRGKELSFFSEPVGSLNRRLELNSRVLKVRMLVAFSLSLMSSAFLVTAYKLLSVEHQLARLIFPILFSVTGLGALFLALRAIWHTYRALEFEEREGLIIITGENLAGSRRKLLELKKEDILYWRIDDSGAELLVRAPVGVRRYVLI